MEFTLRPYQLADVDVFMEWACDNKVTRSCRLRHHSSKDDTLYYLKEDAIPHPLVPSHMLGWPPNWIHFHYARFFHGEMPGNDQLYWGRCITTLAVKRAVSSAFEEFPDLERIEGIVDVNNKASQRVLEKAGFLKEVSSENISVSMKKLLILLCIAFYPLIQFYVRTTSFFLSVEIRLVFSLGSKI